MGIFTTNASEFECSLYNKMMVSGYMESRKIWLHNINLVIGEWKWQICEAGEGRRKEQNLVRHAWRRILQLDLVPALEWVGAHSALSRS